MLALFSNARTSLQCSKLCQHNLQKPSDILASTADPNEESVDKEDINEASDDDDSADEGEDFNVDEESDFNLKELQHDIAVTSVMMQCDVRL